MENKHDQEMPAYANLTGILALILAIVGFIIPVIGVLFIVPLAVILGAIALYGGNKKMGLIIIILVAVKLIISPTFWINVGAGATDSDASANRFITYIDVIGVGIMIYLYTKKEKVVKAIKEAKEDKIAE